MKTTSSILLTFLLTAGCGGQEADSATSAAADQVEQAEAAPHAAAAQAPSRIVAAGNRLYVSDPVGEPVITRLRTARA